MLPGKGIEQFVVGKKKSMRKLKWSEKTHTGKSSYARYFEEYDAYKIPRKNRKGFKVIRVYQGIYYSLDNRNTIYFRKVVFFLLWLLAAMMLAFNACCDFAGKLPSLSGIPVAVSVLALLAMLYAVFNYEIAGCKMTANEFQASHGPIIRTSIISFISIEATAVIWLVLGILYQRGGGLIAQISVEMLLAASGGGLFWIYYVESHTVYSEQKSTDLPPEGAVKIRI
jgi:hypothetical protein